MSILADVFAITNFESETYNLEEFFQKYSKRLEEYNNTSLNNDDEIHQIVLDIVTSRTSNKIVVCGKNSYDYFKSFYGEDIIKNNPNIKLCNEFIPVEDNRIIVVNKVSSFPYSSYIGI